MRVPLLTQQNRTHMQTIERDADEVANNFTLDLTDFPIPNTSNALNNYLFSSRPLKNNSKVVYGKQCSVPSPCLLELPQLSFGSLARATEIIKYHFKNL